MDCADRIAEMMADTELLAHNSHTEDSGHLSMSKPPTIVCPTHGRAGQVKVFRVLPDIPLCVAESQLPLYKEHYPDAEYIVHPDSLVGMAPKRQWMYDKLGDLFMLDDDIVVMRNMTTGAGEDAAITDPQQVRDIITRLFDQAAGMGAYLVGFNNFAHPAAYRPQYPFGVTGSIAGRALGLRAGGKLTFPNKLMMTDDLYISALNAYFHRFCLRDDRYVFYATGCWDNSGGMASVRTWDRMIENNEFLTATFGEEAIRKKTGSHLAGVAHDAQVKLKVPW